MEGYRLIRFTGTGCNCRVLIIALQTSVLIIQFFRDLLLLFQGFYKKAKA
ncbi:TPA: hypothetical protein HA338_07815 [Methanosarcina acetivorans]|uniref:Uncharacterized protein n=1 Tax=Methanosarcina acetivorans TaxID=2214 RepID=A0A832SIJ0_9EURY|nr:hypothetical protein [Methanosarcina acetivorans]